ncbi:energy transducer TonB [Yoonia sp.]|uniref:energy transducer TonB n=1 Tax=Yoonia sp. TaxID=2212373 RepID=UPI0025E4A249|nr:energy transducer TonB [Yoonia sp.]
MYISAAGHVILIGWLIVGLGLKSAPLRFETMDVSIVSSEEFAALTVAARTPVPGQAEPDVLAAPEVEATPPPPATQEPPAPALPPAPVTQPVEETPPPPPPAPPVAVVTDQPPVAPAPPAPPPAADVAISPRPTPRQAPTVASTITAPPPPDSRVDDVVRQEAVPDQAAEAEVVEQEQEATAPPETTTEIVIADEAPSGAVETSIRPSARPNRPAPPVPVQTPAPAETPAPRVAETPPPAPVPQDDINALLSDLGAEAVAPAAPAVAAGPPMTGAERDSFRVAVNRCWNVDPGSVAARVTVEVGFSLDRSGQVDGDVRLIGSDGDRSATNTAFEAARRAILRCQSGGYALPAEKYDQWKDVVITFDPSGMRMR